ncbi:hypothetical protein PPL_10992 [Heterostelium album PN500]|uniref:Uncharacterized protein n=1 Tax=Heterostelium pallidum (strain ATCC 26659 / Pp 5 / PN500) TaxID=670386 RepID=D3BSM3_HETP5|nr:hypothetical protein PPL_10992 [Heterostelium album PN500]EFA75488.1 hypothetical protein PPL_10992 [Heterostelium album PN500]|eukprot:XP_020427622.1 hypothetical protein PPL_10992 [Heterostelium album PN500]
MLSTSTSKLLYRSTLLLIFIGFIYTLVHELGDNPLLDLYNFIPFHQAHQCSGSPVGVGFGTMPLQCSTNITGTFFVMPLFGTSSFNLTSNLYEYCNDEIYTSTFDLTSGSTECQYNLASNSSYLVYKQDWPVKIPPNSVLYQSMFALCSSVSSYWFATNNTAVINPDGSVSTFYCNAQNHPYEINCNPHNGCRTNALYSQCELLSPYQVTCTN